MLQLIQLIDIYNNWFKRRRLNQLLNQNQKFKRLKKI